MDEFTSSDGLPKPLCNLGRVVLMIDYMYVTLIHVVVIYVCII